MWRYAGCQKFEFGEQKPGKNREGEDTTRADWGLVANCHWRIEGPEGFALSWEHFGSTPERRDGHADPFYERLETRPLIVEAVEVRSDGALRFRLSDGFSLAVDLGPPDGDSVERWRFMPPNGDPRGHLVLEEDDISWSG